MPGRDSDEVFQKLREGLIERAMDKESFVRVQAVIGLAKLQGAEGEGAEEEDDESNATNILLDVLEHDPAA